MNNNLIETYFNYKLNRLKSYAFPFLHEEKQEFLETNFTAYFKNYINVYYYHKLEALDYNEKRLFDEKTIEEEFNSKKLELLDDLSNEELILSNDEYKHAIELVTVCKNIALLVTHIDKLSFNNKEEIAIKINSLRKEPNANSFFTDDIESKLVKELKETYLTETKFFKDISSDNFKLEYKSIKDKDDLKILNLAYNIKMLESNYKKKLIDKTFKESILSLQKCEVIIRHISKEILLKRLHNDVINPVFIEFDEAVFGKKTNADKVLKLLDNKLLRENINILITYSAYSENKNYLEKNSTYHFSCIQDLTHIYDIGTKLNNLEALNFFDYIIISGYKEKDKEFIEKYEVTNVKELLFYEGE